MNWMPIVVAGIVIALQSLSVRSERMVIAHTAEPEHRLKDAGFGVTVSAMASLLQDRSADPGMRALAALALGRSTSQDAVAPLVHALDDPSTTVRTAAVTGLGTTESPIALAPIIGILVHDPDPMVRRYAASALEHFGDSAAASALLAAGLNVNEDEQIRIAAISALAGHDASVSLALEPLFTAPQEEVRLAAAGTAAVHKDRRSIPALVALILDPATVRSRGEALEKLEALVGEPISGLSGAPVNPEETALAQERVADWWETHRRFNDQ